MTDQNDYPEYDPMEERRGFLYALFIGLPSTSSVGAPRTTFRPGRDRDRQICSASVSATALQVDAAALRDRRISAALLICRGMEPVLSKMSPLHNPA